MCDKNERGLTYGEFMDEVEAEAQKIRALGLPKKQTDEAIEAMLVNLRSKYEFPEDQDN